VNREAKIVRSLEIDPKFRRVADRGFAAFRAERLRLSGSFFVSLRLRLSMAIFSVARFAG
jgi:hypothetical protein